MALGLSAIFPTVNGLIAIVRRRRLGITVSIVATPRYPSRKREDGVVRRPLLI